MGLEMTNIQLFYILYIRGTSIKGQRYFAKIYLSREVLVPINHKNRGVRKKVHLEKVHNLLSVT